MRDGEEKDDDNNDDDDDDGVCDDNGQEPTENELLDIINEVDADVGR